MCVPRRYLRVGAQVSVPCHFGSHRLIALATRHQSEYNAASGKLNWLWSPHWRTHLIGDHVFNCRRLDNLKVSVVFETKGKAMGTIEELMKELPPDLQKEVEDFARFLLERRTQKHGSKLRQDWAGALREYRAQYTSLELQKKALEWRGD